MSQEELAERMGTKQPAIARLETGRANPRLDTLVKAAEALDAVVRVQFAPAEDIGRGVLARNWWEGADVSERHPDVTFDIDITFTVVVAGPRLPEQFATTARPHASFDATNSVAWLPAYSTETPAFVAVETPNGA